MAGTFWSDMQRAQRASHIGNHWQNIKKVLSKIRKNPFIQNNPNLASLVLHTRTQRVCAEQGNSHLTS